MRGARVTRLSPAAIFQRLVTSRGAEPPIWMLSGFLVALGGARLVVHLILKYGLEKRLFALVPGKDPNPMHVHHFNYGLILICAAGVLRGGPERVPVRVAEVRKPEALRLTGEEDPLVPGRRTACDFGDGGIDVPERHGHDGDEPAVVSRGPLA